MEPIRYKFKISVFGNGNVGKEHLIQRHVSNRFDRRPNVRSPFDMDYIEFDDKRLEFQIYHISHHHYIKLSVLPMKGSKGGIFVFDLTNKESLKNIDVWISCFKEATEMYETPSPILLVGNKLDLSERREVSMEKVEEIVERFDLFDYFETSAKTGENVKEMFRLLENEIFEQYQNE